MKPGIWEAIVVGAKAGRINIDQPFEIVKNQAVEWLFSLTSAVEREIQPEPPEAPEPPLE